MTIPHAVLFLDHHCAKILLFGPDWTKERKINAHMHLNRQSESHERSRHEFFGKVCDGLNGVSRALVVGGLTRITDFKHHVQKHRPEMATLIADYEPADHPSVNELMTLGRQFARDAHKTGTVV